MAKQKIIFGIDEVGRGPLAGPVLACAITALTNCEFYRITNYKLKDSKKTNPKKRERIYELLRKTPQIKWGIGRVSEKMIDKINIFEATKLAMIKAVKNLEKRINKKADLLLLDGNFYLDIARPQKSIIRGDEKVPLISLASIIAKVERDCLMKRLHKKYPQYGFAKHKGYGTKLHKEMIARYGPCLLHRQTFAPIKDYTAASEGGQKFLAG